MQCIRDAGKTCDSPVCRRKTGVSVRIAQMAAGYADRGLRPVWLSIHFPRAELSGLYI